MIKFAVLAVAATVAAPGYSASVQDADVDRLTKAGNERALVFQTLVEETWVGGEARERGIVVTDADVNESINEGRTKKQLSSYLRRNGLTLNLLRRRARASIELIEIRNQITEPAAKSVTPDQVKAYVDANPLTTEPTRTVRIVRARSRAEAKRVLARVRAGTTLKALGAETGEVTNTSEDRVFKAIFRAPLNRTIRYGTYVFKVIKETPGKPLPRAQQEAQAWERLSTEAQARALEVFLAQFTEKWRARTSCAPAYAAHPSCPKAPTGVPAP
ncbi:hypothetical protein OJ997_09695 [Solirubrobacter phytolaccae]|uniref:peptidylprolyl isomerase n=1 Tax=Solirubrobacter phytolaccae TaxID=1404360 RepID=A0A9X3N649_9ACTN|nr:hypothetical protein [Solirubrobacter phytolaccae]MDA0180565.1 hypothetical protein [Solirubrobacter phytolaccae]